MDVIFVNLVEVTHETNPFKNLSLVKLAELLMESAIPCGVGAANLMGPVDRIYHLEMDFRDLGDPFVKICMGNIGRMVSMESDVCRSYIINLNY